MLTYKSKNIQLFKVNVQNINFSSEACLVFIYSLTTLLDPTGFIFPNHVILNTI